MERICRGQNPPLRQNLPRFKSSVIQYNRLNIQQDQVIYFSGFFVVGGGGFYPITISTFSNVYHYIKDSYRLSFVFFSLGDFVPTTILPSFHVAQYGLRSIQSKSCFGKVLSLGRFYPK